MRTVATSLVFSALCAVSAVAQQHFVVTTVAGTPGVAGIRDGAATEALFDRPTWVDFHRRTHALYVVDRINGEVRKISGGNVSTLYVPISGTARLDFRFDGPFGGGIVVEPSSAGCGSGPYGEGFFISRTALHQLAFVTDNQSPLLAARDDAQPYVGSGSAGAADGNQVTAQFNQPTGLALSWNYGGGGGTYRTDRLYIADTGNHTIRRVSYRLSFEACPQPYFVDTLAGSAGEAGSVDGPPSIARFNTPRGIASAPDGSLYVADTGNHTIRRIGADGTVTTVAGEAGVAGYNEGVGRAAHLNMPSGIDVNARGEVFIADTGNHVIRKLTQDGRLVTIAGQPGVAGYADGDAASALFAGPVGIRLDGENLYIADTSNNVIRQLTLVPTERRRPIRH